MVGRYVYLYLFCGKSLVLEGLLFVLIIVHPLDEVIVMGLPELDLSLMP